MIISLGENRLIDAERQMVNGLVATRDAGPPGRIDDWLNLLFCWMVPGPHLVGGNYVALVQKRRVGLGAGHLPTSGMGRSGRGPKRCGTQCSALRGGRVDTVHSNLYVARN
jgi:hypothetical protein